MRSKLYIIQAFLFLVFIRCQPSKKIQHLETEKNYIFFIHNKFLEENPDETLEKKYNVKAEYNEILKSFNKDGFVVLSEKRKPNTNGIEYAKKIVLQIDSLIQKGIKPNHITVIGTSKGGYIAQFVSTFAKNPNLNFVFIGSYQDTDIHEIPAINFCGNILTIYEKSDVFGVTAVKRKETSKLKINHFKEIELNTGLKHGFLYIASDEWLKPCKMWAKRNYEMAE
ncbi:MULTISPECIES: alpha/beta hydrolase [Chryseobacterium]|uniref:alpha/beta hydrolase n=1 Tax=Chryseobacterium TaxID=59732 RepID=UPI000C9E7D9A|nr:MULTISPECIES: alpha/beta hydrolase [Chryseobacterium]VXB55942.1 Alpha/beta hydrolase [Chryseobacterium sp. 8AT]